MPARFSEPLIVRDFAGGLNLRDQPSQLAENESPSCMNATLNERGGAEKRLGYELDGPLDTGEPDPFPADVVNSHDSVVLGLVLVQAGDEIYKRTAAGAYTLIDDFTTAARVTFVDFDDVVVMVHPVDGIFTTDGSTFSSRVGDPIVGQAVAAWQGKVWVADGTTIYWSAIGDPATWSPSVDFVRLLEPDDRPVVKLTVSANGGLVAQKRRSSHRILDSETGANATIDPSHGAAGPLAAVTYEGLVVSISDEGIFVTDGLLPLEFVSSKVAPVFREENLAMASLADMAAGVYQDRVVFSLRRAGGTANDLTLEYHPQQGWIVPHSFGASCFVTLTDEARTLFHGDGDLIWKTFVGGADAAGSADEADIASHFQTRWFDLNGSYKTRMRHLHVIGRTPADGVDVFVKRDYMSGDGDGYTLVMSHNDNIAEWDSGDTYDVGLLWGPGSFAGHGDIWSLGTARHVSFLIRETSDHVGSGPPILEEGLSPEVGAWALYGFQLEHIRIGGA